MMRRGRCSIGGRIVCWKRNDYRRAWEGPGPQAPGLFLWQPGITAPGAPVIGGVNPAGIIPSAREWRRAAADAANGRRQVDMQIATPEAPGSPCQAKNNGRPAGERADDLDDEIQEGHMLPLIFNSVIHAPFFCLADGNNRYFPLMRRSKRHLITQLLEIIYKFIFNLIIGNIDI